MSQITNDSGITPNTNTSTAPAVPAGNSTQQAGTPGAGDPPLGNEPEAGAGLLSNAGLTQQQGEGKNEPQDGAQGQKGEVDDGKDGQKSNAPEKYELKTQEGFEFSEAVAAEVTPLFRELNLNNEQAQKLADYHMGAMQKAQQAQVAEFYRLQQAEMDAVKADAEVGGANLEASLALAARAMDTYGGEDFRAELTRHGMANNLAMVKFLAKVGRELSGDRFVAGNRPQQQNQSDAKILYPSSVWK